MKKTTSNKFIKEIISDDFKKLYLLYEELYENRENKEETKKRKQELQFQCPECGSIFREYMCQEKHICTIFKLCPICGNETSLSC